METKPSVSRRRILKTERTPQTPPWGYLIAGLILFIGGIAGYRMTLRPHIDFGKTRVMVQLAKTPAEQAMGLSGRTSLPDGAGMLFVYTRDIQPNFWMKDMKFPLDIIWLKSDGEVADITANISPNTCPSAPTKCQTFAPDQPIRYVLEINAGLARQHSISVGDHADIQLD